MINQLKYRLHKWRGGSIERDLYPYQQTVKQINALEKKYRRTTAEELKAMAGTFREQARSGIPTDELLVDAFALVREICRRETGMRPYDVQLIAAIALHQGRISELQTGEGKTLAAVLPACLNALSGQGVHLLTFNDYLAQRDAEWMGPVYEFMGLSVGTICENMDADERRSAYQCDITYATAKQVGFDYLRSFIAYQPGELILPDLHYGIIDEADALLIDEARNPLVLAGNISEAVADHNELARIAAELKEGEDFQSDEYRRNLFLTDQGIEKVEKQLKVSNLHSEQHQALLTNINLALHARILLHRDIDYIVRDGQILLVDEFTGRVVEDRKWPGGLQTALEAKEGLEIQSEGGILGSVSLQHFIQQYPKIAGMTATACGAAEEFRDFYGLDILVVPPNRINIRKDLPDLVFTHMEAKISTLLQEVKKIHQSGRPILIGTLTVKESEELGDILRKEGISCQILNAKNDQLEATIIAEAGAVGAVTISTNMAGRGTDIRLGGSDGSDYERVRSLGGLHVIGTNRHESERIDLQLRGRAGRQGDPGSSQFIISFEDPLMERYRLKEILPKAFISRKQEAPVRSRLIKRRIDLAQRTIKSEMSYMRRTLFDYTDFIEKQRLVFQGNRQKILLQNDVYGEEEKDRLLNKADQLWFRHLEYISQLREGIHFVRLGGQTPIRIFHRESDQHFELIQSALEDFQQQLRKGETAVWHYPLKRPSSTWTYVVNDHPFKNQMATFLMSNSNIGFQTDFITLPVLFLIGLFKKISFRKKIRKNESDGQKGI